MKQLFLAFALFPCLLTAQEKTADSTHKKRIRVVSFGGYIGTDVYHEGAKDIAVFQQGAPSSALAFADLNGYVPRSGGTLQDLYRQTSATAGLTVNLQLPVQREYAEVRVALSHSRSVVSHQSYFTRGRTPLGTDTLTDGSVMYKDSISYSSYIYTWSADVIHLHVGWIVRTDPRRWLNCYAGLSVFGGAGVNGKIWATHFSETYRHTYDAEHQIEHLTHGQSEIGPSERLRAPSLSSGGAYIPIGLNLRVGRRRDLASHLAVFGEYNGGVQFLKPKGMDALFRTTSSLWIGVRWYIDDPGTTGTAKPVGYRRGNTKARQPQQPQVH
jgi:hypothetical protein